MTGKLTLSRLEARRKELRTIYQELDFQRRAAFVANPGATIQRPSLVDFQRVAQVEDLVLSIQMDQRRAFTLTPRYKKEPDVHANPVGKVLLNLHQIWPFVVDPRYRLSPRVRLFLKVMVPWWLETQLLELFVGGDTTKLSLREFEALNNLVDRVRQGLADPAFTKELNQEQGIADRRYENALRYVDALRRRVGDLLVIPLEIYAPYLFQGWAGSGDSKAGNPAIVELFNSFKAVARHEAAMRHVVGFVGCWEHSQYQRVFARVLFLLDAAQVPDGKEAADAIRQSWIKHTNGMGGSSPFYLSSAYQDKLLTMVQVGRGKSHAQRQLLEVALRYFTQQELVFRDNQLNFDRFFRGEVRKAQGMKSDSRRSSVKEAATISALTAETAGGGELAPASVGADAGQGAFTQTSGTASPQPEVGAVLEGGAPSGEAEPMSPRLRPSFPANSPRPRLVVESRRNRLYIDKSRNEEPGEK